MCAYVLGKEASKLMSEVCLNPPFRSQPSFLTEFFVPDFYWGAPSAEQLIQELSFAPCWLCCSPISPPPNTSSYFRPTRAAVLLVRLINQFTLR